MCSPHHFMICPVVRARYILLLPKRSGFDALSCQTAAHLIVCVIYGLTVMCTAHPATDSSITPQGKGKASATEAYVAVHSPLPPPFLPPREAHQRIRPALRRCRVICKDATEGVLGQILVVAGDVKHGSSVSSEGDICVLGRLSGHAHAGRSGDRTAVIRAQQIDSSQIQIAGIAATEHLQLDHATLVVCSPAGQLELKPQGRRGDAEDSQPLQLQTARLPETKGKPKAGGLRKGRKIRQLTKEALLSASPPARAALVTGLYILIAGLALLLAPLSTFTLLFDQRSVAPAWIRVGGVLAMLFGAYYLGAAHGDITGHGLQSFYLSTVLGRLFLFAAFSALVVLRKSQWQLMILAVMNLFGAFSMQRALSRQ